jgi:hypothetical protein
MVFLNFRGDYMNKLRLLLLILGVFAVGSAPLHAGVIFQFDELGNLAYSLSGAPYVPMANGTLELDPTLGLNDDVLVYNLTSELTGNNLFNGDVPIEGSDGIVGDLRFTDSAGATAGSENCLTTECLLIFYVFDSNGLLADVGPVSTSFLTTQTPGATLSNGAFSYTAGVLTYDGTIAPEPAPAVMLLLGLAVLVFLQKRPKATVK